MKSAPTTYRQAQPLRPLIATDELELLEDVLRLAAAAQLEPDVATSLSATRARWMAAPMVVVGADTASALGSGFVPKRPDVIVATREPAEPHLWQRALELGADKVVVLPDGESWLIDRFACMTDRTGRAAPVACVVGARGGAGASTLAGALAVTATRAGISTHAVDLDPLGPGFDMILGTDVIEGLRWGDLARTKGRVPAGPLSHGMPSSAGVGVLTWSDGPCEELWPGAAGAAIDALRRISELVIVDLPRSFSEAAGEAICRATRVLLVVPRDARSVSAAARVISAPQLDGTDLRLLTRGVAAGGLRADQVSEALGVPLLADYGTDRSLDRDVEAGLPPGHGRRSQLRRASEDILRELGLGEPGVRAPGVRARGRGSGNLGEQRLGEPGWTA